MEKKEENRAAANHTPTAEDSQVAGAHIELPTLLEASLDRMLGALGLEMGAVWLHPHYLRARGLPKEALEIAKAACTGLSISQVQAVSDWQEIGETHPELARLAGVMQSLGIRASIAASLQHEGRTGWLVLAVFCSAIRAMRYCSSASRI